MIANSEILLVERIEHLIFLIRGQKVMFDFHLAKLYGVETKALKRAVKRNISRFPRDFIFELTKQEYDSLRYQIGTLKRGGHVKYLPYAFTEQGVAMLSSVLRSEQAAQMNIAIMRTFVKMRELVNTHRELAQKLIELEQAIAKHDSDIQTLFQAIRQLMQPIEKPKREIGFKISEQTVKYKIRKESN